MAFFRHNWVAFLFIFAIAFFVYDAHRRADLDSAASVKRSVDTCRRSNPGRAYLQLRAEEFTKTDLPVKKSYTTSVSPLVFQILDCKDSVAEGKPISLPPSVSAQYLRDFKAGYVDKTRGPKIVGRVPFNAYFLKGEAP